MPRGSFALVIAAALVLSSAAHAAPARSAFLLMSGRDTLSVESVQRTRENVAGTMVFRAGGVRYDWVATFAADGSVSRFDNAFRRATDSSGDPPRQSATFEFRGDSVIVHVTPGGVQRFATTRGAMPFLNPSIALTELLVRKAHPAVGGQDSVALFTVSGGATLKALVSRPSRDSVVVALGGVSFRFGIDADGFVKGGSVPEQGLTILERDELPPATLGARKPDYSSPAGAPSTAENVTIPARDGSLLAGTLTLPKAAHGALPCVLTITGSGPQECDESLPIVPGFRPFRQIAEALAARGIAVLRMDDRGTGESGGSFKGSTSADFARDAEDALAWLRKRPGIDGARLALLGHSEGGLIGPMVASRDPGLRALVVLAGPSLSGREIIAYQNGYAIDRMGLHGAPRDSAVRAVAAAIDSTARGDAWMRFFLDYQPLPTARKVRTPTLILQGDKDWQVTPGQADQLAAAMREGGNRDVTVHRLADTDHLFLHDPSGDPAGYASLAEHEIRPAILAELCDWLVRHLK